jgi:gliding motility-associated-like protein
MFRIWKILFIIILGSLHSIVSYSQDADTVRAGQRGVEYSVLNTTGSSYDWFVLGGKFTTANGFHKIIVNWGQKVGNYKLGVIETNKFGCVGDTIWLEVFVNRTIFPTIYGREFICEGETIQLRASSEDSVYKDISYEWSTGDITENIELTLFKTTKIFCVLYYNGDAIDTAFKTISVIPNSRYNFSWSPLFPKQGENITFSFNNKENLRFAWVINGVLVDTLNDSYTTILDSIGFNKVDLVIYNTLGCEAVKTNRINIEGENLFQVPNAFTPNGDGNNDEFYFKLPEGIKDCKIIIFNRWGTKVFETNETSEIRWDGKYMGRIIEKGAYIIDITANTFENRYLHQSGTLAVID